MKNFIATIALFFFFVATSFGQAEQTITKSLVAEASTAVLQLSGKVETSTWDKDFIRITATVKVTNSSDDILKKLILVGRYEIQVQNNNGEMIISMPKLEQTVVVKGVELAEIISYEVQIPSHLQVVVKNNQAKATAQTM